MKERYTYGVLQEKLLISDCTIAQISPYATGSCFVYGVEQVILPLLSGASVIIHMIHVISDHTESKIAYEYSSYISVPTRSQALSVRLCKVNLKERMPKGSKQAIAKPGVHNIGVLHWPPRLAFQRSAKREFQDLEESIHHHEHGEQVCKPTDQRCPDR